MLTFYLSVLETQEEKDLLETLYYEYRKRMKAVALSFLKDEDDAEDAVQQAFLRLIRGLDRIQDPYSKDTQAFIVLLQKNACKDLLRKKRIHSAFDLDEIRETEYATHSDPYENLLEEDLKNKIEAMPEIYRDTLMLKVYYELSNKKIAEILNISIGTVRKRLQRARTFLQ